MTPVSVKESFALRLAFMKRIRAPFGIRADFCPDKNPVA